MICKYLFDMRVRLLLSYKGSRFFGWQRQKGELRTVQAELEKALFQLFQTKISLTGSGRTDAGTHALGQNAHFEIEEDRLKSIPLQKALNAHLPSDITVLGTWRAPEDFHARFSAVKKTYLYFISAGEGETEGAIPVLFPDLIWHLKKPLPIELKKLDKIAHFIKGRWDFKSFQNSGSEVSDSIRTVYQSEWRQISPSIYCYQITANGFLKQMVRNLVGACIELLKEEEAEKQLAELFARRDRSSGFKTAPSQGLYLKKVFYPPSIEKACKKLSTN